MMNTVITKRLATDIGSGIMDGPQLLGLARGWLQQGNPVVAQELLLSALGSPQASESATFRAQVLKESGRALMMQSRWDAAESEYLEGQRLFLENREYRGASECARNRANMCFQQGRYSEAQQHCEQALDWATEIGDHELRATILNTLAAINSATGELREALKTFGLCLADFRAAGNVIRQGYVHLNIGLTSLELHDHSSALSNLNEALAIALSEKDLHLVEICYQNISRCYLAQNECQLARSVVDTARRILPGLNSKALETELNLIEGKVLRTTGDFSTADTMLEKTYRMAVDHNLTALQTDVLFEQGLLQKDLGNHEAAVSKLNAAAHQYRQIGMDKSFQEVIQTIEHLERRTTQR
ncbi:MAG: tetratricopeptide repeat protein [candidate division Zixibacteria bacterium]|nr:tetratricopeptide repeat protein [candidate division Zixibacteria bacterium]